MFIKAAAHAATVALAFALPAAEMKSRDLIFNQVALESPSTLIKLGGQDVLFGFETTPSVTPIPLGLSPGQRTQTIVNGSNYSPVKSSSVLHTLLSYNVSELTDNATTTHTTELYLDALQLPGTNTHVPHSFFFSDGAGILAMHNVLDASPGSDFLKCLGPQTKIFNDHDNLKVVFEGGIFDNVGEFYSINKTNAYTIDNVTLSLGGNISQPFTVGLDFTSENSYFPSSVLDEIGLINYEKGIFGFYCNASIDFQVELGDQKVPVPTGDVVNRGPNPSLPENFCVIGSGVDYRNNVGHLPVFGYKVLNHFEIVYDLVRGGFYIKAKKN